MKLRHKDTVIIVTGGPGTGKSYAARRIQEAFPELTLLSYDVIKEQVWDRFGFDNAQQKDRVNRFSLEEFYLTFQKMMWQQKSILIEYPFNQRHKDQLCDLIAASGYHAVTLLLYGDWKIIYERGLTRNQTDQRHPGHLTNTYHKESRISAEHLIPDAVPSYEEFRADIDRKNYDIQIGETIRVDVTDFSRVDFEKITGQIATI